MTKSPPSTPIKTRDFLRRVADLRQFYAVIGRDISLQSVQNKTDTIHRDVIESFFTRNYHRPLQQAVSRLWPTTYATRAECDKVCARLNERSSRDDACVRVVTIPYDFAIMAAGIDDAPEHGEPIDSATHNLSDAKLLQTVEQRSRAWSSALKGLFSE